MLRSHPLDNPEVDSNTITAWERHLGERVDDPVRLRERLSAGSLPEAFARSAQRDPDGAALTIDGQGVTHGGLDEAAGRAATGLARFGVEAGDRVLLVADVGLKEIAAYLGILRLGATVVLANPSLTGTEIVELASASEAVVAVGSGLELVAEGAMGSLREIVGLRPDDRRHSSVRLDITGDPTPVSRVDPDSTAVLAFTSGSTGRPKPTPLTHRNLLASIRSVMAAWRWTAEDHLVHALPISHQHGLGGVHATLLAGNRATLLGRFDPDALSAVVEEGSASIHFGVAAIYRRLLDHLGHRARNLADLRLATSGSGPLPVDLFERYEEKTGSTLLERYGTTESGLNVSNLYDGPRLAGHVGLPLPGVELALVDGEGNLTTDGAGEVLIRGPHVFDGFLGVSPSDQPFFGDWFRTGDIAAFDESTGYLRIVGRSKEVIISGGMNVYPGEVEDAIREHPGVEDVAVVGAPSERWGEEVVAVVAPSSVPRDDLAGFLVNRLAGYKRPKRIVVTDEIPRNPVGKVVSSKLSRLISASGPDVPTDGIASLNSK